MKISIDFKRDSLIMKNSHSLLTKLENSITCDSNIVWILPDYCTLQNNQKLFIECGIISSDCNRQYTMLHDIAHIPPLLFSCNLSTHTSLGLMGLASGLFHVALRHLELSADCFLRLTLDMLWPLCLNLSSKQLQSNW